MYNKSTCPCCGEYEFSGEPWDDICPVCEWERDGVQEDDPDYKGGANHYSLNEYRKRFEAKKNR